MALHEREIKMLRAAARLIQENLADHWPAAELAARVGMNRESLRTGFNELFGMGVHAYRKQQRMIAAMELLEITDMAVKTIAQRVGYKSSASFDYAFMQITGLTPVHYRNLHRKDKPL